MFLCGFPLQCSVSRDLKGNVSRRGHLLLHDGLVESTGKAADLELLHILHASLLIGVTEQVASWSSLAAALVKLLYVVLLKDI